MESNDRMTTAETVNDSTNTTKHGSVTRRKKLLKANIQLDLFLDEKNDEQIIVEIPNSRSTSTRPMSAYFPSEIAPHYDDDDDDSDLTGNDLNQNKNDDSINNDLIMDTSNKTFQRLKKRKFSLECLVFFIISFFS